MKFYSIEIKFFRGIQELTIEDLKRINLFVGKNNSGKTSILEAFFLSIGANNPELITRIDLLRDLGHTEAEDFRYVFYDFNYKNKPTLNSQLLDKSEYRKITISPVFNKSDISKSINSSKENGIVREESTSYTESESKIEGVKLITNIKPNPHSKGENYESTIFQDGNTLKVTPPKGYDEKLFGVYIRNSRFSNLYERLEKIIINKEKSWVIESLQNIDNRVTDIVLGSNNMIYLDIGFKNGLVPCNIMGDGIINILSIIAAMSTAKNGFIMIDEVDNGLHYTSLENLWRTIDFASKKYSVQVFSCTHSLDCTIAFAKHFKETEDNNQLLRVDKINGLHKITPYNNEELLTAIQENWEIR